MIVIRSFIDPSEAPRAIMVQGDRNGYRNIAAGFEHGWRMASQSTTTRFGAKFVIAGLAKARTRRFLTPNDHRSAKGFREADHANHKSEFKNHCILCQGIWSWPHQNKQKV